ncbi:MAG: hypothetical protein O7A08_03985 [SAR324 cluster bacterium]|nr:hypothetical protein [SAR324 cluster bacterium]MCZ6532104.1 hypothetical protein [SAR324 cluster bacterium]MCZ6558938.1 hypothetical protein [SAR324 cluster bacterium]MCZ6645761.1 hypothetical protein [SAR324 cluster bacterium]MCZ6729019.1 hypothetical protein [SAR324 cluster bacterium]
MPNKPTDLKPKTGGTVVLRDESDEIIDTLKNQLNSLQEQLDAYKNSEGPDENAELMAGWNQELTPHLASRLQVPAEELANRLDRLIDQVGDPELREELERCRDLAFFFYETFHKISNNHRLLTESLTAPKMEVDMADFCRVLEYPIPKQSMPFPVEKLPGLPKRIFFASRAAATVMQALAELATNLFGKDLRIEVGQSPAQEEGAQNQLALRIYSGGAGEEAEEGEEVSVFALRRGVTANTVVDLLYVEKIVELQGGLFAFDRREGKVFGFRIHLPYDIPSS